MYLRTLLWNIGGCKIRNEEDDPKDTYTYCNEGLNHVIKTLKYFNADILFLQETHLNKDYDQARIISKELSLNNFCSDALSTSHIGKGYKTGLALISKYPLLNHQLILFVNPNWKATGYGGEKWHSLDRGFMRSEVKINDKLIQLNNAHLLPFHRFKKNPLKSMKKLREDMAKKLKSDANYYLLQGDFNYNEKNLKNLLPGFFDGETLEIKTTEPTRPSGKIFDRTVYRGLKLINYKVYPHVLTDHYPIFSEFEIA